MGEAMQWRTEGRWEFSVLSAQFCCPLPGPRAAISSLGNEGTNLAGAGPQDSSQDSRAANGTARRGAAVGWRPAAHGCPLASPASLAPRLPLVPGRTWSFSAKDMTCPLPRAFAI